MTHRWAGRSLVVPFALVVCTALAAPAHVLAQDGDAEPLPEPGTALEPGRYVSSAVGPTIDFRVDEGWLVVDDGASLPVFVLERSDQPGAVLTVTRFDGGAFLDSCDPTSLSEVEASVPRLIEIIAGNPFLNPGPPSPVEVDGLAGTQLDVATPAFDECSLGYLLIWALPVGEGDPFVQVADQQSRFIALDVEGDVIVIAIETFPGVPFGGLLDASMDLVESMRIVPGEYVPPPQPSETPEGPEDPDASPTAGPGEGADAAA
jgi:hypothetical protein